MGKTKKAGLLARAVTCLAATIGDGAGYLPRQTPDCIPGADGMWYNTAGQGFNPNVVPSYVADTYTAYNPALQRPVSLSESPV